MSKAKKPIRAELDDDDDEDFVPLDDSASETEASQAMTDDDEPPDVDSDDEPESEAEEDEPESEDSTATKPKPKAKPKKKKPAAATPVPATGCKLKNHEVSKLAHSGEMLCLTCMFIAISSVAKPAPSPVSTNTPKPAVASSTETMDVKHSAVRFTTPPETFPCFKCAVKISSKKAITCHGCDLLYCDKHSSACSWCNRSICNGCTTTCSTCNREGCNPSLFSPNNHAQRQACMLECETKDCLDSTCCLCALSTDKAYCAACKKRSSGASSQPTSDDPVAVFDCQLCKKTTSSMTKVCDDCVSLMLAFQDFS